MSAVEDFLAAEIGPLGLHASGSGPLRAVAGIGTMAPKVLGGWKVARTVVCEDPGALVADGTWQLAVVLSPWKRSVSAACDALSPSASATGVVDTVVRTEQGVLGVNTNTWAAQAALTGLMGDAPASTVLLVGSGASARSVALAVRRAWPSADLRLTARRQSAAEEVAAAFGASVADAPPQASAAARLLIVNATTWGETDASEHEPFAVDLSGTWGPGVLLFDLNNRVGSLPAQALASGSIVASGSLMQSGVNAMRAALAPFAATPRG